MDTQTAMEPFDLGPACGEVARLLGGIKDDQLAGPTPCPDYAVREVLAHLVGLTVAFRDAAAKKSGPTTDTPPDAGLPVLPDDWREMLPRQLDELAESWRSPAAWEGATRVGGVDLPGAVAGLVALNEVQIHGWDLARSTGQPYAPAEASLRASFAMLAPPAAAGSGGPDGAGVTGQGDATGQGDVADATGPADAPADSGEAPDGVFGPPVEVPEDAPLLDRVVGLTGRRPDWRPGE
ncbi:TIGR03086 family metal-binding protein [Streptomyces sp. NPDC056937]|uniref:TIGR03086 family metal-binding protein n=1 Tax=Streptomyces sp. NPDC056937 TaxID=3345969 RepID=UPI00362CE7F0